MVPFNGAILWHVCIGLTANVTLLGISVCLPSCRKLHY